MVGLWGTEHSIVGWIQSASPICHDEDEIASSMNDDHSMPPAGAFLGRHFERRCPRGMAVRAIRGMEPGIPTRLSLICQDIDVPEIGTPHELSRAGGTRGVNTHARVMCSGRGALVTLSGNANREVDRLGGMCETLERNSSGNLVRGGNENHLAEQGGWGGDSFEEDCPPNTALVGLILRAGARIDQATGVCVDTIAWDRGLSPPQQFLNTQGGMGGSPLHRMCPSREFLVGWQLGSGTSRYDDDTVHYITPICRSFRLDPEDCNDDHDNDGDGLTDCEDSSCTFSYWCGYRPWRPRRW